MKVIRSDTRIENEIRHGAFLANHNAGEIWGWETEAGKIRWKRRVELLTKDIKPGITVLEIGCGTGYFSKELVKTNSKIIAIDISYDLLKIASANCRSSNITFIQENAYETTFNDGKFDFIIGSSVLHHLDVKKALREFFRLLKEGGCIRFTEPNMLNPQIALQKNVPYIKRKLGDSPDETAFIRWVLKKELVKAGFCDVQIIPFDFLHPHTPKPFIKIVNSIGLFFESCPIIKEISGSLFITAYKRN